MRLKRQSYLQWIKNGVKVLRKSSIQITCQNHEDGRDGDALSCNAETRLAWFFELLEYEDLWPFSNLEHWSVNDIRERYDYLKHVEEEVLKHECDCEELCPLKEQLRTLGHRLEHSAAPLGLCLQCLKQSKAKLALKRKLVEETIGVCFLEQGHISKRGCLPAKISLVSPQIHPSLTLKLFNRLMTLSFQKLNR